MNWLRDNILKILIFLGLAIVAIIIIAILVKPKSDNVVKGSKYNELETKLQNAAIRYVGNHKKLLPTSTENVTKIKLSTLQGNNYIGKLVAVDDSSVICSGYVDVEKISEEENDYRYTPYITCGKYYTTKTIGDYIIDVETKDGTFERTTDDGLYKVGDEYIFRGEEPNNFLEFGEQRFRIIKIENDKTLKLISTTLTERGYVWDDRYNIDVDAYYGITDFFKSRLYDSLVNLYTNEDNGESEVYFSEEEKNYIIKHDFCIGKRSENDSDMYSGVECKEKVPLMVGLLTVDEVSKASLDINCKTIYDRSCNNYNYFHPNGYQKIYSTLTTSADSTYKYYLIKPDSVITLPANANVALYPVIYINPKTIYATGTGSSDDPYIVR